MRYNEKNIRVGFFFPHPLTHSLGSTYRIFGLAGSLKKMGVEPLIITPYETTGTLNGIKIVNIPNVFSNLRLGNLIYSLARYVIQNSFLCKFAIRKMNKIPKTNRSLLKVLQRCKLDLLQIEQEPTLLLDQTIFNQLSIPLILDFHGIWSEELVESNVLTRESPEYRMLQDMVRRAVSNIQAVVVMSEEMKKYVKETYNVPSSMTHVVELGAKPHLEKLPEKHGPPKVVHTGTVSHGKHVDLFINSIPFIIKKQPNTRFYITRKGDLLNEIHNMAKTLGIQINYFWFAHESPLYRFMSTCHTGVLTSSNNISYRLSPPAKLFDYMSVGLPIVANDIGGWTSILKEEGSGILTADDPQAFSNGVLELIENPELAQKCGQRGLELTKGKYNWDNITEKLVSLYETLAG